MACTQQSGTCSTCQGGCERKPGWFMPGQAEKAAEHLGMTLQEFFDTYLAVDWFEGSEDVFVLSPALASEGGGGMFPADPTGRCIFFKEGRCEIHEVKPFECSSWWCDEPRDGFIDRHHEVAQAWLEHQDLLGQLLGHEPYSSSYSIFDALGMGNY